MVQVDPASVESQDEVGDAIESIILAASAAVLAVIVSDLAKVTGETSYVDVAIGSIAAEKRIESIIADCRNESVAKAKRAFHRMADGNDEWAARYFYAKGIEQKRYLENAATKGIIERGIESAEKIINDRLNTGVLGIAQGNRLISTRQAYISVIQDAVASLKAGEAAYTASVQRNVRTLSESGLRVHLGRKDVALPTVRYARGRNQEVYSVVRMEEMRAYRVAMDDMRMQQGEEFEYDGVEISAHALCAPDHQPYQGNQYTIKEFDDIQSGLDRPLIEGANCHHRRSPIILGVSPKAYSREQLAQMRRSSNETITFTGVSGKTLSMTRYEASQYQRSLEAKARKYATRADLEKMAGVSDVKSRKAYKATVKSYGEVCIEAGLKPRKDRMKSSLR